MYEIYSKTGDLLDMCATLEAAQEVVDSLEFVDKQDDLYEEGFYVVRERMLERRSG